MGLTLKNPNYPFQKNYSFNICFSFNHFTLRNKKMVGPAGFEPTTFTQEPRKAVLYGFL